MELTLAELEDEVQWRTEAAEWLEARQQALEAELEAPRRKLLELTSELSSLRADLRKAEGLKRDLDGADSYSRKKVHDECQRAFDTRSPGSVIGRRTRSIEGIERSLSKLETRIETIVRPWTLDIRTLIIDGNNLCYEAGKPIGLAALLPLCAQLHADFEVVVIFDASIQRMLSASPSHIQGMLPAVKVYVVATHTSADEAILDAAIDSTAYVVSNDGFAEFPDKPAVRDARRLSHQIINGRVRVPDLRIDIPFEL